MECKTCLESGPLFYCKLVGKWLVDKWSVGRWVIGKWSVGR